jgi:hypothetical protein
LAFLLLGKRSVRYADELIRRPSSLLVACKMLGQLGLLVAAGKLPRRSSAGNAMRGLDFYSAKDFIRALIQSAVMFKDSHGYVPPLALPATFNEYIYVRMFFASLPTPSLADKLTAKDYVRLRVGEEFLPTVAWVGDDVHELFTVQFPAGQYVLKANHGCGWNLFLDLPGDLHAKRDEIKQASLWLTSRYGYEWGEWFYSAFKPMLFLEQFIDFNHVQTPDDYKFFCFDGRVVVIEIDVDRFTRLRSAFYTPDWNHIPVAYRHPPIECPRPHNLQEMIHIAEAIAGGMEFARVDLYSDCKSRIKFGEITLAPGALTSRFSDFKFDQWLGSQFGKGFPK